jgi:hypothetical protein
MVRPLTALLSAALLAATLGIAVVDHASAAPPPPAGGYFNRLPAGATLPSEATCAAAIHRSTWEPRADNTAANNKVPTAAQLAAFQAVNLSDFDSTANGANWKGRINGQFTGTTDELVQFYACKWGLSDEDLRAQMVDESNWHQNAVGDLTSNTANCPSDAQFSGSQCYQSYGLIQDKWIYNKSAYPMSRYNTGFHLDYNLMKLRACFDGHMWVNGSKHTGDWAGCLGNWFSGGWHDVDAEAYIARNLQFYNQKAWLTWSDQGTTSTTTSTTAAPTTTKAPTTTAATTTTQPTTTRPTTTQPTTTRPTTTSSAPANKIANASVESGTTGWTSSRSGRMKATFTYVSGDGYAGSHLLRVNVTKTWSNSDADAEWYFQPVPVVAGQSYTYSEWYRGTAASQVTVEWTLSDGSTRQTSLGQLSASSAWRQLSTVITAPSGAVSMTAWHSASSVGQLDTDDYSLVQR